MTGAELEKLKHHITSVIRQQCGRFDELAQVDALQFARNPEDQHLAKCAQRTVAIADALKDTKDEMIRQVWQILDQRGPYAAESEQPSA
jgi:hypothetical protein